MKLLFLCLLLTIVLGSSQAASNGLTSYWSSHLPGVLMPSSIKEYLPPADLEVTSSQFATPNLSILAEVNILKCHPPQNPPNTMMISDATSLHFQEKDLSTSSNLQLYPRFPGLNSIKAHFIPRPIINGFPALKSTNLPNILAQFSIESNSTTTDVIKDTIDLCENAAKDDNTCITSLENMIDFVKRTLEKSTKKRVIQAFSTKIDAKYFTQSRKMQPYRIVQVKRLSNLRYTNKDTISCHKAEFPFAVFLCHQRSSTTPYMVTLEGMHDKTKIEAATVCHMDTSDWDPRFPGLVALKVKPGTPVCHFLNQGSVLWVANF